MPVFRWGQTWDAFRDLEREVDRLLSNVNFTFQGYRVGRQYPALNLYELEDEFLFTAEVPGTKVEELELTMAGGIMTIKGLRSDPEGIPEERFRRQERLRGPWQRSISIPERVQEEQLTAELKDGLLKIHLPKVEDVSPRQIPVVEGDQ
jgi:HSP20 family protein